MGLAVGNGNNDQYWQLYAKDPKQREQAWDAGVPANNEYLKPRYAEMSGGSGGVVSGTPRSYVKVNPSSDDKYAKYAKYDTIRYPSYENHEYLAKHTDYFA